MTTTKVCLSCGNHTTNGNRCKPCQQQHDKTVALAKGKTASRGLGSAWQTAARQAIHNQPWCTWCGTTTDLTADHIIPRSKGGTIADGIRVLCRPCNSRRGAST